MCQERLSSLQSLALINIERKYSNALNIDKVIDIFGRNKRDMYFFLIIDTALFIISQPAVTELSLFDLMLHRRKCMYSEVVLYYKIKYLIWMVGQVVDYTSGRSVEDKYF